MSSTITPICVNTYGIKIRTSNLLPINKVMVREYVVQLTGTHRLPHTKCFSLSQRIVGALVVKFFFFGNFV